MKIELYSASFCSNCATLKKILNEINIDYSLIDIDTPEGAANAQENRVKSLPTTIITTDNIRLIEVGSKNKSHWLELLNELIKE